VKGARTERDLVDAPGTVLDDGLGTQAIYLAEREGGSEITTAGGLADCLVDVIDTSTIAPDEMAYLTAGLEALEAALRRRKSGNPDRFARLLAHMATDLSVKDLAEAEGVSRNRAASLLTDLRTAARDVVDTGRHVRKILTYVSEEPCATAVEIDDDVGSALPLLPALVAAGWLKRDKGSYVVTRAGSTVLGTEDTLLESVAIYGQL
jgi:hypothetical protein